MKGSEAGKRGWPYLGGAVSGYRRLGVVSGYVTGSVILVQGYWIPARGPGCRSGEVSRSRDDSGKGKAGV